MTFEDFIGESWRDHAEETIEVASKFPDAIKLITTNEQIPQMARLITHVMGEHLGQWSMGVELNQSLKAFPFFVADSESGRALARYNAALEIGAGADVELVEKFTTSDQIVILTTAASALCGQNQADDAARVFAWALHLAVAGAEKGLDKKDPAIRSLAVVGNNLATSLEERTLRSDQETALMILAAQTARKYWEQAGTWLEVERAEYRLAMTFIKTKDFDLALNHARLCLEISQANEAAPLELFFAYEALAMVARASDNTEDFDQAVTQARIHFDLLPPSEKPWCEASFKKLI